MNVSSAAEENVDSLATSTEKYFHPVDYAVFAIMLVLSAAIGIYIAFRARGQQSYSSSDYLMAGRTMTYGPVAFSLVASFMSSVTVIGVPAEYYVYGTMFTWFGLVYLLLPVIVIAIYMPVFYDLGINSVYTYLEMRFDKWTRLAMTCLYLLMTVLYGGIVTYGPALALNKVTGMNMWGSILCTGVVCIFYTALGGLKAVVWTDVLQSVVMISGFIVVIIQGSINMGGFSNIWAFAEEGGRIDFSQFGVDPRIRHSFWSILIGGTLLWTSCFGINQCQVQRYVCCRTKRDASMSIILSGFGLVFVMVLAGMTGLTIYATYKDCDPINDGTVDKADQLFPYIIVDIAGHLSGIPGLFVAAVYSSSLSTISSGINAMACVTLEDFIKPATDWCERSYTIISRVLVIAYGFSFILVAYAASQIGGLLRMSYSMNGILGGPMLGVFTVGMLVSWVNHRGALCGLAAGIASTVWLFVGAVQYPSSSTFTKPLPRSTDGCKQYVYYSEPQTYTSPTIALLNSSGNGYWNSTVQEVASMDRPGIAELYSISYLHYSTIGFLVTGLTAMGVSLLTERKHSSEDLLSPFMRSSTKKPWKELYFDTRRVRLSKKSCATPRCPPTLPESASCNLTMQQNPAGDEQNLLNRSSEIELDGDLVEKRPGKA